jgi:hypothetical protein
MKFLEIAEHFSAILASGSWIASKSDCLSILYNFGRQQY